MAKIRTKKLKAKSLQLAYHSLHKLTHDQMDNFISQSSWLYQHWQHSHIASNYRLEWQVIMNMKQTYSQETSTEVSDDVVSKEAGLHQQKFELVVE